MRLAVFTHSALVLDSTRIYPPRRSDSIQEPRRCLRRLRRLRPPRSRLLASHRSWFITVSSLSPAFARSRSRPHLTIQIPLCALKARPHRLSITPVLVYRFFVSSPPDSRLLVCLPLPATYYHCLGSRLRTSVSRLDSPSLSVHTSSAGFPHLPTQCPVHTSLARPCCTRTPRIPCEGPRVHPTTIYHLLPSVLGETPSSSPSNDPSPPFVILRTDMLTPFMYTRSSTTLAPDSSTAPEWGDQYGAELMYGYSAAEFGLNLSGTGPI